MENAHGRSSKEGELGHCGLGGGGHEGNLQTADF